MGNVRLTLLGIRYHTDCEPYKLVIVCEDSAPRGFPGCLSFMRENKLAAVVALLSKYRCAETRFHSESAIEVEIPARLYLLLVKLEKLKDDLRESELEKIQKSPSAEALEAVLGIRKLLVQEPS